MRRVFYGLDGSARRARNRACRSLRNDLADFERGLARRNDGFAGLGSSFTGCRNGCAGGARGFFAGILGARNCFADSFLHFHIECRSCLLRNLLNCFLGRRFRRRQFCKRSFYHRSFFGCCCFSRSFFSGGLCRRFLRRFRAGFGCGCLGRIGFGLYGFAIVLFAGHEYSP